MEQFHYSCDKYCPLPTASHQIQLKETRKIFSAKSEIVCKLYCIWRQSWRRDAIMKIQWGRNLHIYHKSSGCGLFFSWFIGTKRQEVTGRSCKLLWTASILGAHQPGKLQENVSSWLFQAFENVPRQKRSHRTLDDSKSVSCALKNPADSVVLCVVLLFKWGITVFQISICASKMFQGYLKPSRLQLVTARITVVVDGNVSLPFDVWAHSRPFIPTQMYWLSSESLLHPRLGLFSAVMARNSLQPSLAAVSTRTVVERTCFTMKFFSLPSISFTQV